MVEKPSSPFGKIDLIGLKKVGKGALIAGGGAVLTYLAEALPGINFGEFAPVAVAISAVLINFLRKLMMKYE